MEQSQPKPYCILVDESDGILSVRLRLFGAADAHRNIAFDSLIAALCEGEGVDMGRQRRQRRQLHLLNAKWTKQVGIESNGPQNAARLQFHTPLCLLSGKFLSLNYRKLWVSARQRMAALTQWHGLELNALLSDATIERVNIEDRGLVACRPWSRWSSRDGRQKVMRGLIGELLLDRIAPELYPFLRFGEVSLIGSENAFGLGRFSYHPRA